MHLSKHSSADDTAQLPGVLVRAIGKPFILVPLMRTFLLPHQHVFFY